MLVVDETALTYEKLRPLKPTVTASFPVYHDLTSTLVGAEAHPDDTVAHVLATAAGYAYSDAATVAMIMARMGLENNRCRMIGQYVDAMFICSTSFLIQSQDGRVAILAYRGTEPSNFVNWLTDADVYPEKVSFPFGGGAGAFDVHAGFYRNVRATRFEVVAALLRALEGRSVHETGEPVPHPLEALYITGHSLGAAMAAMLAVMLITEPAYAPIAAKLRSVYTFGQPMIGTPEFAAACEATPFLARGLHRYVYRRDVVPTLPPEASGPFAHFGTEHHYDRAAPWATRPSTGQMGSLVGLAEVPLAFVGRRLRMFRDVRFRYSIDDHGPQHYVSALTPEGIQSEFGR